MFQSDPRVIVYEIRSYFCCTLGPSVQDRFRLISTNQRRKLRPSHPYFVYQGATIFFYIFRLRRTLYLKSFFDDFDVLSNEDTIMNSRFLLTFWLSSIYTAHKVQKDFWRVRVVHWTYNNLKFWWFNTTATLLWTLMANSKYTFLQSIKDISDLNFALSDDLLYKVFKF